MAAGVSMVAPETVHLSADTEIAGGAVIEPYRGLRSRGDGREPAR